MNPNFTVLSFPTMPPVGIPFENPYLIDPRTLPTLNDINLWLKSINLIEKNIIELFENLRWPFLYNRTLHAIRTNLIIGDLIQNLSDEQLTKFFTGSEISNYNDVLGKDSYYDPKWASSDGGICNVVIDNFTGRYLGHVYSWESYGLPKGCYQWEKYVSVYVQGIRSSVVNVMEVKLGAGVKGLSYILLSSLLNTWRPKRISHIRIVEPLPPMRHILKSLGLDSVGNVPIPTDMNIASAAYELIIL